MVAPRFLRPPDADISEKDFRTKVLALAKECGWRFIYFRPQRSVPAGMSKGRPVYFLVGDPNAKGFPDLVLGHPDAGVIFRELKTEMRTSRLEPEQAEWIALLRDGGCDAKVWRPRDWVEIQQTFLGAAQPVLASVDG